MTEFIGWKDPHRGRERELMDHGKRLAYLFSDDQLSKFGGEFDRLPHERKDKLRWLVFRPEDRHLAEKFLDVYRLHGEGALTDNEAHEKIGELLGYERSHIERFLQRGECLI